MNKPSDACSKSTEQPVRPWFARHSVSLSIAAFFICVLYPMWGIPRGAIAFLLYVICVSILLFSAGVVVSSLFFYLSSMLDSQNVGSSEKSRRSHPIRASLVFPVAALLAVCPSFFISLETSRRARILQGLNDMRVVATSIENYNRRRGAYPLSLPDLTTPISYLRLAPVDSFAPKKGDNFQYYSSEGSWILWSAGPNQRYELTPGNIGQVWNPKPRMSDAATTQTEASTQAEPYFSSPHLIDYSWDSTNGTMSRGDLWRIKDTKNWAD